MASALISSFYLPSAIATLSTDENEPEGESEDDDGNDAEDIQNDDDESEDEEDDDENRHSGEHQVNIETSGDEVKIELQRETELFESK
nr:hypothetical protein [Euryarchaeota archaeon]